MGEYLYKSLSNQCGLGNRMADNTYFILHTFVHMTHHHKKQAVEHMVMIHLEMTQIVIERFFIC